VRSPSENPARRWWVRLIAITLFVGGWLGLAGSAWGQIVRVEEDWELVVSTPDPDTDGPQVICVSSPGEGMNSLHANFELNLRSLPGFAPGGLQLQVWNGETPVGQSQAPNTAVMRTPGETVRWTQTMQLSGGMLTFEIVGGSSTTWESFGGQGYLKANVATSLADLSGYSPQVSATYSGVSYASNRVASLVLKRVRMISQNGQVLEDNTPRVVYQQDPN